MGFVGFVVCTKKHVGFSKVSPFDVCALGITPARVLVGKRASRDTLKALPKSLFRVCVFFQQTKTVGVEWIDPPHGP